MPRELFVINIKRVKRLHFEHILRRFGHSWRQHSYISLPKQRGSDGVAGRSMAMSCKSVDGFLWLLFIRVY